MSSRRSWVARGAVERLETRTMLAEVPAGFTDSLVGDGFFQPVALDFAPDGRIFLTEKRGRIRVIKDGQVLATPFAVVTDINDVGERGLLGITLDPNFASNGFVYVYYTSTDPVLHNRVSRFTANGDVAQAGSETVILDLEPLSGATNHNGGAIHFGPDGKLYVAQGENADAARSQTLANRFGKVLRINSDGTIPTDNPFNSIATGDNRMIWALGLRNPFTFAFHRTNGRMFINDVGGGVAEEVNEGIAGANYGWPEQEGEPSNDPAFTPPTFFYPRSQQQAGEPFGTVIAGGTFYDRPTKTFPAEFADDYFFADLGSRRIFRLDSATNDASEFASDLGGPVDLMTGPDGSLYYAAFSDGEIRKISFTDTTPEPPPDPPPPPPDPPPSENTAPAGTILSPVEGRVFRAGQSFRFRGAATDAEDGRLAPASLSWRVELHQGGQPNTVLAERQGVRAGSVRVPRDAGLAADSFVRFHLTVTDSAGDTQTSFRDVQPRTVTITVNAEPSGALVTLDGEPRATPFTFEAVTGTRRALAAPASQVVDEVSFTFGRWSPRRSPEFEFVVPASDRTFQAIYTPPV